MRIGLNPNKDRIIAKTDFFHQIIIPVHIPNLADYFADGLKVLDLNLKSLFKTTHSKTYITIVNNGSCKEVENYLTELYCQGLIHELINTTAIGKLNAILKGIVGHAFEFITISDADVLFLENWQNKTYNVYENFPKAGVVSPVPSSKVLKQYTSGILLKYMFSNKLKFSKVVNPKAMQDFSKSIGNTNFYNHHHLNKYLTISSKEKQAVVGAGHFVATYRSLLFEPKLIKNTTFALGGKSEQEILDEPADRLGYWRLSTIDNHAYHMGNVLEDWMVTKYNAINFLNKNVEVQLIPSKNSSSFMVKLYSFFSILLFKKPFWKLFLRWKGLTKDEAQEY